MKHVISLRELLQNQYPKGSKLASKASKTNTHLTPKKK